jgi:phthalate 4,5-dioxygenase oxygenase subunit
MLTTEENELLSRVGPGTKMGNVLRQFWIPAFRSALLARGGAPERVRLLGEDFVAFRAADGRVGVLDEACPHRGVSLSLARNDDCALQCIYHGWKIDVSGKVVDIPTEPAATRADLMARIKVGHYPVREAGTIVWVWLGGGTPSDFPAFNWTSLPEGHVKTQLGIIRTNWLTGLEGQLDSAHVGILHSDWVNREPSKFGNSNIDHTIFDLAPRFEFEEQDYGYREAAIRSMPDGTSYVRVREFCLPWYSYIPQKGGREAMQLMTMSIPIDDEWSAQWDVRYNLVRPLEFNQIFDFGDPNDGARGIGGIETRFGQDRTKVAAGKWTGFSSVRHEDFAIAMAQGTIPDRSREQLSTSDLSIVRARRLLVKTAREHVDGQPPPGFAGKTDWASIRSFAEIIPPEIEWRTLPR